MSNLAELIEEVRNLAKAKADPAYAPLLALMRDECQGHRGGQSHYHSRTAYWRAAPNGAIEGSLIMVLQHGLINGELGDSTKLLKLIMDLKLLFQCISDTRIEALEAMRDWLRS